MTSFLLLNRSLNTLIIYNTTNSEHTYFSHIDLTHLNSFLRIARVSPLSHTGSPQGGGTVAGGGTIVNVDTVAITSIIIVMAIL
jgi:hypothetical protein